MQQVYQLGENASVTLNLLSLGPIRQVKCHNRYFFNEHVFHTEEYGQGRKTYNNGVCVQGSVSNEFEVDYYEKLEEVIELQFHSDQNRVFLFKCYGKIPLIEKSKQIPIMVSSKLIQRLDPTKSMMSLFSPNNTSKFITHKLFLLERIVQELIGYPQ